jgi:MFS family permease
LKGTFRALSVRDYRLYAGGQIVSSTGTWVARVTQGWLVYHILTHDNSFALGVVTALQFLPALVLGIYGGMLGDRHPKRIVLTITQSAMALLSLLSGILIVLHAIELWTICAIALGLGACSALDMPVRQAFVIEMVGRDVLQNAVSLNAAIINASRIVGPAVAGLSIEAFGIAPGFFFNALSYLAVIVGMLLMATKDLHVAPRVTRARGQLRESLSYVRNRPELLLPVVLIGFVGTFGFNSQITNALVAQRVFHRGAGSYGLLSTALAVGSPCRRTVCGAPPAATRHALVDHFLPDLQHTRGGIRLPTVLPAFRAAADSDRWCRNPARDIVQLDAAARCAAGDAGPGHGAVHNRLRRLCAVWIFVSGLARHVLGPRWTLFASGRICLAAVAGCALFWAPARSSRRRPSRGR